MNLIFKTIEILYSLLVIVIGILFLITVMVAILYILLDGVVILVKSCIILVNIFIYFISEIFSLGKNRKLAKSEYSSAETLMKLSEHPNIAIRIAVASNPNAPVEVLEELSWEFPETISTNPVFNLLILENPNKHFIKFVLAHSSKTPTAKLLQLIEDNIHLEDSDSYKIIWAAIANPNTTLEILEKIIRRFPHLIRDNYIPLAIISNPNTSSKILDRIVTDTEGYNTILIFRTIVNHPNTSIKLIVKSLTKAYQNKHYWWIR